MLENVPSQPNSNPDEYDPLRRALLRPIQHQLAKQGIDVSPEEALKLLEQKINYDAKRYLQQNLAEQGIDVSLDEAPKLSILKTKYDIERGVQQDLANHGLEVSPDEAVAIQELRIIRFIMELSGITDPYETI